MRLVTRSDFDGLVCGALLLEAGIIDSWKFAHPKDLQDGLVPVDENDVLANVPFVEGCGLWFDHHSSEHERLELEGKYKGESRITPSCARIIYEYYGGKERFPQFDEMMENWGLSPETDLNKIAMLPQNIGYIRKADIPAFNEMLKRHKQEKATFKENQSNIKAMLLNEMINREYIISGDLAEVLEAVGYTISDYAKSPTLQKAVNEARTDYFSKY